MSKTLILNLADDETFTGSISVDGQIIASACGNVSLVKVQGAVHEFTSLLRVIAGQRWERTSAGVVITGGHAWSHEYHYPPGMWMLFLPDDHGPLYFLREAAAISARAILQSMWEGLIEKPTAIYQAFLTDVVKWGFLDIEGQIHTGFPTRADAQGHADRMR